MPGDAIIGVQIWEEGVSEHSWVLKNLWTYTGTGPGYWHGKQCQCKINFIFFWASQGRYLHRGASEFTIMSAPTPFGDVLSWSQALASYPGSFWWSLETFRVGAVYFRYVTIHLIYSDHALFFFLRKFSCDICKGIYLFFKWFSEKKKSSTKC